MADDPRTIWCDNCGGKPAAWSECRGCATATELERRELRELRAENERLRKQVASLEAGARQSDLIRGLPLPRAIERRLEAAEAVCAALEEYVGRSEALEVCEALDRWHATREEEP